MKTYTVYFQLTKDGKLNAWSPTPIEGFIKGVLVLGIEEAMDHNLWQN